MQRNVRMIIALAMALASFVLAPRAGMAAWPPFPVSQQDLIQNGSLAGFGQPFPPFWFWNVWNVGTAQGQVRYVPGAGINFVEYRILNYAGTGDAKVMPAAAWVPPGTPLQYADWRWNDGPSDLLALFTYPDGSISVKSLGYEPPVPNWTPTFAQFVVPAWPADPSRNVGVQVYHSLHGNGMVRFTQASMRQILNDGRPILVLTFDDGRRSQYEEVLPVLELEQVKGTFCIIASTVRTPEPAPQAYLELWQVQDIKKRGHDICNHFERHVHPSELTTPEQRWAEVAGAKAFLEWATGGPVELAAYPFGERDPLLVATVRQAGHLGARTVDWGFNLPDADRYQLKALSLNRRTSMKISREWMDLTSAQGGMLIINMHLVLPQCPATEEGCTPTRLLEKMIWYAKSRGFRIATLTEAAMVFWRP